MSGDQKIKTAQGKVPLDLVPLSALKGAARVFGYGAKKYAKGNWYCATDDEFGARYAGGALRHLSDAQRPDGTFDFASLAALDEESGLPEIDHMLCGLIMLRGLCVKRGVLAADPGVGKEPPALAKLQELAVRNAMPMPRKPGPTVAELAKDAADRHEALIAARVARGEYDVLEASFPSDPLEGLDREIAAGFASKGDS